MRQFIVPQFIEEENKIIGPITVRQFILMVVGGVVIFVTFRVTDMVSFLIITLLVVGLVFLFGFLKVNGAYFHIFLLNLIINFKKPNLRVWNKNLTNEEVRRLLNQLPEAKKESTGLKTKPPLSTSRLAELSLILDTRGEYQGES